MGQVTNIEWCDHTFNGWRGCSHAVLTDGTEHPGCLNCYAERWSRRNPQVLGTWGDDGERVVGTDDYWRLLRRWDKLWAGKSRRGRVFCFSLGDIFEDRPELELWRDEFFAATETYQNLNFLCLTKRPQNIRRMMKTVHGNVWLGTSISNQQTATELLPHLLKCRDLSPVLFASAEPLLSQVELLEWIPYLSVDTEAFRELTPCLDWVIVGGESGPSHREMPMDAARHLVSQCRQAGVATFVKQDSGPRPGMRGRWTEDEFSLKEFPRHA